MTVLQWILIVTGLVCLYVGLGLVVHGTFQKRAKAGPAQTIGAVAGLITAITGLVKALADCLGPEPSVRVGGLLIIVGFALIIVPFVVPGMAT